MDRTLGNAGELELGTVADAITMTKSCGETTAAAPTPSSCLPAEEPSTTLQIKEEIKEEEEEEDEINDEDVLKGEQAGEQSEREEDEEEEEEVGGAATTTTTANVLTDTSHKISLPWDFSATAELCRSCGKPHTELYELFENEQSERTSSSHNGNNDESNHANSNNDNSSNNNDDGGAEVSSIRRDPRAITRAAIATKTTKQQQKQQQLQEQSQSQPSKMDNILQEMQIWQLRIKPNDGLPQRICPKCTAQFYIIGKFRRKCLKVQIRLRTMCEEQQQLLEGVEAKDTQDVPQVPLDIGNELINDNFDQPLSGVELFETNWNATEATNSGTLIEGEMLVDERAINTVGANEDNKGADDDDSDNADDDDDDEEEDIELTNAMCNDAALDGADMELDSTPCLGTSIDLAVKTNSIDGESLQDSAAMFKTSQNRRKRMRKNTAGDEAEDNEELAVVLESAPEFVADSTDNNDYDPLEEEAMSANKVEIISIESLKNIDIYNVLSSSKEAAASQKTLQSKQRHELDFKGIKEPNMGNTKDCKETQKELTNQRTNETSTETTQTLLLPPCDSVNIMAHKEKKTAYRIESPTTHAAALVTHPNSQNATRAADSVTPTTLMKLNEEGMKAFVSKAALKEYDSSPSSFDDSAADNKSCNVDPKHAPLQTQSSACINDSFENAQQAMEDNPEETLIIPYAQKRRKKCRIIEKAILHKQKMVTEKHEIESVNADSRALRGCSVRLCRLRNSKKLTTTTTTQKTTTTPSTHTNNAAATIDKVDSSLNADDICVQQQKQLESTNEQQSDDSADDENMPILKKIKLVQRSQSFLMKRRGSHWKTKAEMKAVNEDPLSFRKPSLRRQMKLGRYALVSRYDDTQPLQAAENQAENTNEANVKFTDEEEIASEDLIDNIKVEPLEQPTTTSSTPCPTTTDELRADSEEKGGPLKMMPRKSRYHEKLRLKKNLRANLLKLRQHNITMATNLKRQMEGSAEGGGVSATAVSIAHDDLSSMATEPATPVAEIDKVLATTFDLPTDEFFRDSLTTPLSTDKPHELESTKNTTTTETFTSEASLDKILTHREDSTASNSCSNEQNGATSTYNSNETPVCAVMTAADENLEAAVSAAASSSTQTDELDLAFEAFAHEPMRRSQKPEEQDELIVRVPLAVLTQEFQRMHFSSNEPIVTSAREELPTTTDLKPTAAEASWLATTENVHQQQQDGFTLATQTQSTLDTESTAASAMHHHLPTTTDDGNDFADVSKPETVCNLNESDQSEFYGFGNESDPRPSYDTNDSFIPEKHSTMISSQINDYINEFQTHCLEADEKSPPSFANDSELINEKNTTNMQTLESTRGLDNYVDNTLNGLLDEIQEQNLFSPSTTPLVTMESEDFHHHSSYSPLSSESSHQTQRSHPDYMKNSMCDLSPGPTVNPSHVIDATSQHSYTNAQLQQQPQQQQQQHQQHQHQQLQQHQQHHYNNYVECFTEDSTQSELIGFQNDIPCFENIELNSSTPRHNSTPPPPAAAAVVVQQDQLPTTPVRAANGSLQVDLAHPGTNLKLSQKQVEAGNIHYLGLGNESDLCQSINTDSMGLVCTTGNGVQMHTPTLKSATGQIQEIPYERETLSSESSDNSREYAVDSATLHFTQIFHDMPLQQQHQGVAVASTSQNTSSPASKSRSPNVVTSKKSTILAKYAASNNNVTRNIFSNKIEPATLQLPAPKFQYVTLPPQHSTLNLNTDQNSGLNTQLLAASSSLNQEMLNLGPTKYTLYTEVLPQDLQWQTTGATPDQQTTTTYYINAADLNQSNLISTTTIAMSPLITGAGGGGGVSLGTGTDLNGMTNLTLLPTQLSQPTATIMHNNDKRSMDANENYMEGMQNQSIMIVFPQDYINDPTSTVSTLYNTATGNQLTLAPLQSSFSAIVPPPPPPPPPPPQSSTQLNNATMNTTIQSNAAPIILHSSPVPVSASATAASAAVSASHPSRQPASPLQLTKINLTCRFCHKRPKFTNNLDYSNHIIETHPGENPFNCPHCPMFFTRRAQRLQHIVEAHGANRFNCAQCGQSFCAQRALDLHLQRAHVPNDPGGQQQKAVVQQKPDATASCSRAAEGPPANFEAAATTTTWHERLAANAQQQIQLEDVAAPQQVSPIADDFEDSSNADNSQLATESSTVQKPPHRILGCPDCDDSFDDLANQEPHTHQLSHTTHHQMQHTQGSSSNLCTMPSPEQTEPDSTSTTTLRQFRKQRQSSKSPNEQPERVLRSSHNCVFCEERFTNELALRKHHQTAHGNQTTLPFVCSMCKRGFRMRTALQRHMETHDSVGRPYECSICLVRFPRPSQLTLHKLTVHFLRKPHACNICGKQFGTESALKTHEKFHGEKKISCDDCPKKFFLLRDLRKHRRLHTGEHFYKCDICPKTFVHYKRLCAHIKTHIPLGMCIEEDPPSLHRDREQREREQLQLAATESVEQLNEAAIDDNSSSDIHQAQHSL